MRFLEKLALKLGHFAQKLQVLDQIVTVNWFNLIQNELFFPKLPLIRYDTFKNNPFRAKNISMNDLLIFHLWETGQNTGKFHLCAPCEKET